MQCRSLRNNRGQNSLPAIEPKPAAALLRDATEALADSERLRAEIFKQQQLSRRRGMELDYDCTEAVRRDAERLASEGEALEAQLVENMRQLNSLEQTVADHNTYTREQKKQARAVAAQLRKLREVDGNDSEAASIESNGMKALKDVHRQMDHERQSLDTELQRGYHLKERTEYEIQCRRQALALNEGLLRACHERSMVLPEFDDHSSCEVAPWAAMQADASPAVA